MPPYMSNTNPFNLEQMYTKPSWPQRPRSTRVGCPPLLAFWVQDHVRPRALSLPVHVQDVPVHTTLDVVERTTIGPASDEQPGRHFVRCITPTFRIEMYVYTCNLLYRMSRYVCTSFFFRSMNFIRRAVRG